MNKIIRFPIICYLFLLAAGAQAQIQLGIQFDRPGVEKAFEINIDVDYMKEALQKAPPLSFPSSDVTVSLPLANGEFRTFSMFNAPLMQEGLADRYPQVRNYKGFDVSSPDRQVRLNVGPLGVFAIIVDHQDQSIIQPLVDEKERHELYFSGNTYSNWTCELSEEDIHGKVKGHSTESTNNCTVNGTDYYIYDLVVTTTGEFYNLNGGSMSSALNALTNRLAAAAIPYERDLAMSFQLVSNNDIVMYTDAMTDPFSAPTNTSVSIGEAEATIESNFNNNEYDIGHGYHEITCGGSCGWGGLAGVAVACIDDFKASAWTFQPNDIATNTVWTHELGHQLSCWHTNYGCGNTGCHRYEPGAGASIMSTGAGCTPDDDYANRVDYFHAKSIDAIIEYTTNGVFNNPNNNCAADNRFGFSACAQVTASGNTPPTVTANPNGLNLTIPINTPFYLEGTASDPESDPMTFSWVDYNTNVSTSTIPQNSANSTTAPLFRWFAPGNDTFRLFPQLSSILNGNNTVGTGEVLPAVGRTMDFRFLARDNASPYGAIACDEITVTVDGGSGPFQLTSQNTSALWTTGNTVTISWDVNNTDQSPINASNVDILLSNDGGTTFNFTLASNVANDGSHTITVPSINTSQGRIKLQPSGNYIFFDINDADITISDPGCAANAYAISPTDLVTAEEGDPALNLSMENEYGVQISNITDATTTSDPLAPFLPAENSSGSCIIYGNTPYYKIHTIFVTNSGSYTLNESTTGTEVMNLYSPEFNPSSVCQNFLQSSLRGSNFSDFITESLVDGQEYQLFVSGINNNSTISYQIDLSGPGNFYDGRVPVPGYSYTYVIVNDGSGNIVDFDPNADLSNEPPGDYSVYGVHYDDNVNLVSYEGGAFSTFQSDIISSTVCASISSNSRPVQIQSMLPLTFLQFTAQKGEEIVNLIWDITEAFNVSHFRVEKWDQKQSQFLSIGEVDFRDSESRYRFIDEDPIMGNNLYRIASVDHDGFTQFTAVRSVLFMSRGEFHVYPSPVRNYLQIDGPIEQIEFIHIYDRQGLLIRKIERDRLSRSIAVFDLVSGLYVLQIQTPSGPIQKRIIVQ